MMLLKNSGRKSSRRVRTLVMAALVSALFWMTGLWKLPAPAVAQAVADPAPAAVQIQAGQDTSGDRETTSPADTATTAAAHSQATAPSAGHGEAGGGHDDSGHHTVPHVLLGLLLMLTLGKIGGDLFTRIGQPAVLGELIFGIILGNVALLPFGGLQSWVGQIVGDPGAINFLMILSEIGVILLLFEVGLESTVHEMVSVGVTSFVVAVVGVVFPMALGFGVGAWFLPDEPSTVHLFLGAVLAATSVGITARVLRDLGKTHLREAKIVLGAAVIDDILGLVVLAVAQGVAAAAITGEALTVPAILIIIGKAVGFFAAAILLGRLISSRLYRVTTRLHGQGVLLTVTLGWCFLIAYLGTLVGVAPIVGAFAAGLVLEEATFEVWHGRDAELEDLLRPLTTFLVPVFFVYTGMNVNLATFGKVEILGFAAVLTLAAIIGKQACALAVLEKGLNRTAIGLGMVPRGEVGLIVANVGRTMKTPEGTPLISDNTFSAVVIMVVITTMMTPPLLKWALERNSRTETA